MGYANTDRRHFLGALAAVPVAASAITVPTLALAKGADRSAWNEAVAKWRATEAEQERLGDLCSKASDAAEAACPRREEFFKRYDLGCGISRSHNLSSARHNILIERLRAGEASSLSKAETEQVDAEAIRVVDDFEEWVAQRDVAYGGYDELEKRFDEAVDANYAARQALFKTPAPDNEALLLKIEWIASFLDSVESEDSDKLEAICSDARRLLSNGRA